MLVFALRVLELEGSQGREFMFKKKSKHLQLIGMGEEAFVNPGSASVEKRSCDDVSFFNNLNIF